MAPKEISFHEACFRGVEEVFEIYLARRRFGGLDVNALDSFGQTGLSLACAAGQEAVVDRLLSLGSPLEVDKATADGTTAFSIACKNNRPRIVEMLLAVKPDKVLNCNVASSSGMTGFHYACMSNFHEVVDLLLQAALKGRVDVDARNKFGQTGFLLACKNGYPETVELLIKFKGNLDYDAKEQNTGNTGLHFVCEAGLGDLVSFLVKSGKVDLNAKNLKGKTAAHLAPPDSGIKRLIEEQLALASPAVKLRLVQEDMGDMASELESYKRSYLSEKDRADYLEAKLAEKTAQRDALRKVADRLAGFQSEHEVVRRENEALRLKVYDKEQETIQLKASLDEARKDAEQWRRRAAAAPQPAAAVQPGFEQLRQENAALKKDLATANEIIALLEADASRAPSQNEISRLRSELARRDADLAALLRVHDADVAQLKQQMDRMRVGDGRGGYR